MEREHSCHIVSESEFEFMRRQVTKDDIRELIYGEILEYHPLLKNYMSVNEGVEFRYPRCVNLHL